LSAGLLIHAARRRYDVCIDTATALKRWDALAAVHGNMGNRYARGNDAESLVLATEQYKLAAEFCTMWSGPDAKLKEAHWKCCLGWTFKRSGHSDKGFEAAHEALREARGEHEEDERPDMRGEAEALKTLGALHENLGDFDEAQECYESALDLAVRCGDRRQEFNCLHYLGVQASYNYSDWQKARSIWERALGVAVDLQCENAEAHACAELAIVIRNLIPRRPQKESPEEAEAAELTKTAVAYYVRAKELKEAYVNGTGVGSGPSSPTKSGGGDPGSPSSATSQMLALTAPKAVAPTSPSRNNARVWKFELVHDDKDSLLDYGVDPREHHERCPPPVQEYSINLSGNETMLAEEGLLMSIEELASEHPENICLSSLDSEYFASLPDDLKPALLRCMNSGVTNPDSKMGCYACHPEDYDRFSPFFSKALAKYHGVEMPATHISSWELDSVPGLPEGGVLDLEPLGLMEVRAVDLRCVVYKFFHPQSRSDRWMPSFLVAKRKRSFSHILTW
jgi:tetratricopeptide (TPR) repeat protein